MQYENPQIPEKINYSDESPLKEFLWLVFAVGLAITAFLLVLHLCAKLLAPYIPFSYEQKIAQSVIEKMDLLEEDSEDGAESAEKLGVECYLENLVEQISLTAELPEGMRITPHYSSGDTVNAFATLGGHIVLYQGILDEIETENALTMLVAHEIAHVKHRDPIVGLSRGVITSLAMGLLSSSTDSSAVGNYLGSAGLLTQLSFSRKQEENADELALAVVQKRFGHVNGAEALFEKLHDLYDDVEPPAFMSSHPPTEKRIERIKRQADGQGKLTPLPDFSCASE